MVGCFQHGSSVVEHKKVLSSSRPLIKDDMPICRLCDSRFPVKTRINGEVKNLSKRVYCLSCSPWGCHNTKKLETNPLPTRDKVCLKCDKPYANQTGKPCHGTLCNACYQAKRRLDRKKELVDLMGGDAIGADTQNQHQLFNFIIDNQAKRSFISITPWE